MFCPKCGANLKDGSRFCSKCGCSIGGPRYSMQPGTLPVPPKKKKGKTGLIIFLAVLLVLLIAGLGMGIFYYINEKNNEALLESIHAEFGEDKEEDEEDPEEKQKGRQDEKEDSGEGMEEGEDPLAEATMPETIADGYPTMATEAATTGAAAAMTTTTPTTGAVLAAEEPVTVSLQYSSQVDFHGLVRAGVVKATAVDSSHVVQPGTTIDNTGWSAFDGQATTSWQEGVAGHGIGQYVGIGFDQEYQVRIITFLLGNHRSDAWYAKNDTPRILSIQLGDQVFSVTFPKEKVEFAVVLSRPVAASSIRVVVDDVYPGTEYEDATIAEIGVYGN